MRARESESESESKRVIERKKEKKRKETYKKRCECKEENRICAPHTQLIVFDDREQFSENSFVSFMKSDIVGVVVVVVVVVVVCFLLCFVLFCFVSFVREREKVK